MSLEQFIRDRITELRIAKNVSERRMSEELGKNPGYIHQIVSGRMNPSLSPLLEICEYFGITLSELCDDKISDPVSYHEIIDSLKLLRPEDLQVVNVLVNHLAQIKNNS